MPTEEEKKLQPFGVAPETQETIKIDDPRVSAVQESYRQKGQAVPSSEVALAEVLRTQQKTATPQQPQTVTIAARQDTPSVAYEGLVPQESPEERAARQAYEESLRANIAPVNEEDIRTKTLNRFQSKVDALNRVYAEQLAAAQKVGLGALGTQSAIQARRGLAGSTFGEAATRKVQEENLAREEGVRVRQGAAIASVLNQAENEIKQEVEGRKQARLQGAASYLDYISKQEARKKERIDNVISSLFTSQITPDDSVFSSLAQKLNTTPDILKNEYNLEKKNRESEKIKAEQARAFAIAKEMKEVAPGASIFDPFTGKFVTAPIKPSDPTKPTTEKIGDTLLQWSPEKQTWQEVFTAPEKVDKAQIFGTEKTGFFRLDESGKPVQLVPPARKGMTGADLDEPKTIKDKEGNLYTWDYETGNYKPLSLKPAPDAKRIETAQSVLDIIKEIKDSPALGAATGPIGQYIPSWKTLSGEEAKFKSKVETLKSLLTLENMGTMKGVLSDADMKILAAAASSLNYGLNAGDFKGELERIEKKMSDRVAKPAEPSGGGEMDDVWGFSGVGADTKLGSLSEKYESGGNPGAIGWDSTGGYSYGAYQMTKGTARNFALNSSWGKEFRGKDPQSKEFQAAWQRAASANPEQFKQEQKEYIQERFFEPQIQKLAKLGVDINELPGVLKDVIWSTAVQHGPATNIVVNALRRVGSDNPIALVKQIYRDRWSGGRQFASSTDAVKRAVYNRFFGQGGEMQEAINRLA